MTEFTPTCPFPVSRYPNVTLAHGGGGRLGHQLVDMLRAAFDDSDLNGDDAAILGSFDHAIAMTTDGFVVSPRFFRGGSIGSLSVCGVANDLACMGARAEHLALSFILEEGLAVDELWRIAQDIGQTARAHGIAVVTGDTKVVQRGRGDGVFINATGVGQVYGDCRKTMAAGDIVVVSGDVGRHGVAVMVARQELGVFATVESDCDVIWPTVSALIDAGIEIKAIRDLTRGGLATCLNELARDARMRFVIEEEEVPVNDGVSGACELLGLDPLYVANEGTFVAIISASDAVRAVEILKGFRPTATRIGDVRDGEGVVATNAYGSARVLDVLSGEQLPRIC